MVWQPVRVAHDALEMIIVDSSVWIDYFNGTATAKADRLDSLLGVEPLAIGDFILLEVLQGFREQREFDMARRFLSRLTLFELLDAELAVAGASNYRHLRQQGITVRKSVDTVIATFCIERGHTLLFSDRDFNPFVEHLNLRPALD